MICSQCKREVPEYSNFCSTCGASQHAAAPCKRLMLSATDSKIAGVCGGLAEYFNIDATVVRLIWAALTVVPGAFVGGILAYVFAWIIIPKAPQPATNSASAPEGHAVRT